MVKKASSFRERLILNWMRIDEIGIAHRIFIHFNGKRPVCSSKGHFESIRLEYVAPAYLFLFSIYVCSILILFVEVCISKFIINGK